MCVGIVGLYMCNMQNSHCINVYAAHKQIHTHTTNICTPSRVEKHWQFIFKLMFAHKRRLYWWMWWGCAFKSGINENAFLSSETLQPSSNDRPQCLCKSRETFIYHGNDKTDTTRTYSILSYTLFHGRSSRFAWKWNVYTWVWVNILCSVVFIMISLTRQALVGDAADLKVVNCCKI